MIILEGMDNSGKTTLANQLLRRFHGYGISKLSEIGRPTNGELFRMAQLIELPAFSTRNVIMDRFSLVSELVYGEVLRGDSYYGTVNNWSMLEDYINNNAFFMVYCRPPTDIMLKDMGEQMPGVKSCPNKLITRYDEVIVRLMEITMKSPMPGAILKYDWKNDPDPLEGFLKYYNNWRKDL